MKNECQTRRRAPHRPTGTPSDLQHEFARRLDAVDFHIQALRYRAGLPNALNEEEKQVIAYAGWAVAHGLSRESPPDAETWEAIWGRHASPMLIQAIATELQWRQDLLAVADVLEEA